MATARRSSSSSPATFGPWLVGLRTQNNRRAKHLKNGDDTPVIAKKVGSSTTPQGDHGAATA